MLSPRYLDGLSDEITEIYSQLETDILQDMARRLARLGKVTDATRWQAQMLVEAGGLKKDIPRILAKYDKAIVKQIQDTVTDALETNARNDNRIFKEATGRTVSSPNAQQMLSTIQKCHSDLSRLTLTTAATTETEFARQASRVYMNVQSGAFDYDTAMKDACNELSKRGITTVQYENGRPVTRTIESAVRMNILTSINQTAANQTLGNCETLGCDLVETSAHIGARPEHEDWQGEVFSRSGTNPKYRPFSVCELGSVTGICGINCKHSFYPYFEGMAEHYTEKELDEMASEKVTYTDKDGRDHVMTRYEGEQKLRYIEKNIRHYKREALTQEAAGVDNTRARRKIGEWQAAARDFTTQTGIARDSVREYVGTPTGKQPTGLSSSIAAKPTKSESTTKSASKNSAKKTDTTTTKALAALVDNPKSTARAELETLKVEQVEVKAFKTPLTQEKIIKRISGGDKTKGSCSSLGFSYVANKAGFDVLDFRGGKSCSVFSKRTTIEEIAKLNGVKSKVLKEFNDFTAAHKLYKEMESGKQYYFATGKHGTIIQQLDGDLYWLEMQSANPEYNTWHILNDDVLKNRFRCQKTHTKYRKKYKITSILIDIESLGKNKEFIELMKYINTSEGAQLKGVGGYAK